MPDSSDNVNARDGASIVWGPEIRVNGKRPEWLADGDIIQWSWAGDGDVWLGKGTPARRYFQPGEGDAILRIRLPANHPHYRQPTTPELDPALWDRMVALVRLIDRDWRYAQGEIFDQARAIVAALPKPVDPDDDATKQLLDDLGWALGSQPLDDVQPLAIFNTVKTAIRRGRELAGEQA